MTHDPQCPRIQHALEHWLSDCDSPECDGITCQCALIAKVRKAIVDGLKAGLPESDTRDSAVAIATFAVSAT